MAHSYAASWAMGPRAGRWGHWAPQILVVAILSSVLLVVRPIPYDSPLALLAPVVLVGLVITTWLQMRAHDRRLCDLCMASMPLNPSESAVRYRRRLRVTHLATDRRALATYLLVMVAFDLHLVVAPADLLTPIGYGWAGFQSTLVYLVLSHATHRKLQPWCPECGDGGGGRGVDVPDPVPLDSRS